MDIQKEIKELKEMFSLLVQELEKKEKEKEPKEFELYLQIGKATNCLLIGFNTQNYFHKLGVISDEGECCFIRNSRQHNSWEIWKAHGFKVAEQYPVEWQGLIWQLDNILRVSKPFPTHFDFIYNFEQKTAYESVRTDDDFLKKDSDNRINLF